MSSEQFNTEQRQIQKIEKEPTPEYSKVESELEKQIQYALKKEHHPGMEQTLRDIEQGKKDGLDVMLASTSLQPIVGEGMLTKASGIKGPMAEEIYRSQKDDSRPDPNFLEADFYRFVRERGIKFDDTEARKKYDELVFNRVMKMFGDFGKIEVDGPFSSEELTKMRANKEGNRQDNFRTDDYFEGEQFKRAFGAISPELMRLQVRYANGKEAVRRGLIGQEELLPMIKEEAAKLDLLKK